MIRLRHLVAIYSLVIALGINALAWAVQARAQTPNRAGLIVQMADGSVVTRCVSFTEESLTGYELLRRAKLPLVVEVSGMGPAVCKISDTGCNYPQQGCFCQCNTLDATCTYWAYAQFKDGTWRPSPLGAAGSKVRNGDVDGWKWGKGDGNTGEYPPAITFDQICSAAAQLPAAQPATAQPATAQPATAQPATAQSTATATQPTSTTPELVEGSTATPLPPAATATTKPTQTPSPQENPVTATSLPPPTATPAPQTVEASGNDPLPLLGFGAIAAVLVIGFFAVRRRGGA